jgi:hypothetical protein
VIVKSLFQTYADATYDSIGSLVPQPIGWENCTHVGIESNRGARINTDLNDQEHARAVGSCCRICNNTVAQ